MVAARAHDGCLPARLGVQDRLVLAGTEIGSVTRASSAIFSKGYGFLLILSSLDLISSRKGQLETCIKSSVAERQFQIKWDLYASFLQGIALGFENQCARVIRISCLADILTFGAAGTVLNSSSLALLLGHLVC